MRSAPLIVLFLLSVATPVHALEMPDTPAGRVFTEWLAALDHANDESAARAFIESRLAPRLLDGPMEEHVGMMQQVAAELAGTVPAEIRNSSDYEIGVVCQTRAGDWVQVRLKVEPEEPHRIAGIMIDETDPPGSEPVVAANDDALVAAVRAYVDSIAAEGRFSGTVLIAHEGRVLMEGAWGVANRRYNVPNRVDTRFNLGSMNKMFTALAIAQLVEAGKVDWDDAVGKHLPEYPNVQVRDSVTVRQLITHTSGMGSHFTEEFMNASKLNYREPADYLPLFVNEPLAFTPGSRFSYSNAGFFVLGMIVEAASGENYFDYIREHVYGPAGMTLTDSYEADGTDANLAVGYYDDEGVIRENTLLHSVKGTPAGGGYSTVGDLNRFASALLAGRLVSKETLALMTDWTSDRGARDGIQRGYGYGFTLRETDDGVRTFGHGGGFPGINGILDIYPSLGYTVTALANMDGGAEKVAGRIRGMLPRK